MQLTVMDSSDWRDNAFYLDLDGAILTFTADGNLWRRTWMGSQRQIDIGELIKRLKYKAATLVDEA